MSDPLYRVTLRIEGPERPNESYPDRKYRDTISDISVIVTPDLAITIDGTVHRLLADASLDYAEALKS